MTQKITPVLLLILDGFGYRTGGNDNAILHARKPHFDRLFSQYPFTTINASEQFVGLPAGQFGNSEVGHLNIGAGRIVQQDISRIDCDVAENTLKDNPVLKAAMDSAKNNNKALHIMGLMSDGGVHCHEAHVFALIKAAHEYGVQDIRVHAFLDGRDTPPRSAERYIDRLQAICDTNGAKIAGIVGRYWAMDRDNRWERVEPAYKLIVDGVGLYSAPTAIEGLKEAYLRDENDEFVSATVVGEPSQMADGDAVVFMNFRADRARQLTTALTAKDFQGFEHPQRQPQFGYFCTATDYGSAYDLPVAYTKPKVQNGFGEYVASLGLKQLRIAETEKYPHVTYFLSGGEESEYAGEDRILVPSPKVATYDLKPEMSAHEVTDKLIGAINSQQYAAIICNYANGDMVGHSGIFDAAVKAVETLDHCVSKVVDAMLAAGGEVIITADHGNCEMMYDRDANQPHTQHTTDVVPFCYIGRKASLSAGGALKDIAPSLLAMMGVSQPSEMTGQSLISFL
ncbi:2,3-bisphosphoglycerate-independent phosphoglycerate mutase [Deefgea piscis]|uniref:2,3-bisphosphoglycerate-independent phosphoglycerate mutase n=1 Tax=Deefgea piscis TaxID=2739061 RepID=UPI001C7EE3EA|nr:2,3-bisphosphoglycerate-independent phosphoglycerate mutase [Deefgea piscis]QZA81919.1 2,3-bisphosphoglycerate-independent phosphoglycerate mutase [Deefgea piscis]